MDSCWRGVTPLACIGPTSQTLSHHAASRTCRIELEYFSILVERHSEVCWGAHLGRDLFKDEK